MAGSVPRRWPRFYSAVSTSAGRSHQWFSRTWMNRRSARPGFPTLADWLGVTVHIDFLQPFDAVFHRVGRFFIFFPGRFEQWPEERQREQAPVEISQRRLHLNFRLLLRRGGVADRKANRDSNPQCAENGRHRIFAHEIFGALSRAAGFLFCSIPRLAHRRGNFPCCSTKLLTPT